MTGERNAAPPQPEGGASAAQHQIGEGMTRGAGASAEKKSEPLDAPALDGEDGWVVYSPGRGRLGDSSSDDEEALPDDQKARKDRWVRVSVGALFSGQSLSHLMLILIQIQSIQCLPHLARL